MTDGTPLDRFTREGTLFEALSSSKVRCFACAHRCLIAEGKKGVCLVRSNRDGKLMVPAGYVSSIHADPVEKKPFYHVLPGARALTFGMLGCDYRCSFCQNWEISQTLRDPEASVGLQTISPEEIIQAALGSKSSVIVSSYNEPLITSEWAAEIFEKAKAKNLRTAYVSNGNATPEVLKFLKPFTDCYKVDLKSMRQDFYSKIGGKLSAVLETIGNLKAMGFWVEVVTLVIPGVNDSKQELKEAANFIASVSKEIPWHVTAFHGDYQMRGTVRTPPQTLVQAASIGKEAGLEFVYAGNLPGQTEDLEDTYCPSCRELLIERSGFSVLQYRLKKGSCPKCGRPVPGVWS